MPRRPASIQTPRRDDRRSAAARGYGRRWRRYRLQFLRRHPLCAACAARGEVTAATDVDHARPHRGDPALFWDKANHQGLCASCHGIKTRREGREALVE